MSHAKGEYACGNVRTANLDSFWSLLKRGVIGRLSRCIRANWGDPRNSRTCRSNWVGKDRPTPAIIGRVGPSARRIAISDVPIAILEIVTHEDRAITAIAARFGGVVLGGGRGIPTPKEGREGQCEPATLQIYFTQGVPHEQSFGCVRGVPREPERH